MRTSEKWIPSNENGRVCTKATRRMLKKKDDGRTLRFPSCTPDVEAALREVRRAEWNKWMKFNAFIILMDEEGRQLIEEGHEIYPIKWVDTDKNAYLRRDKDYVSVPCKVQESTGW